MPFYWKSLFLYLIFLVHPPLPGRGEKLRLVAKVVRAGNYPGRLLPYPTITNRISSLITRNRRKVPQK